MKAIFTLIGVVVAMPLAALAAASISGPAYNNGAGLTISSSLVPDEPPLAVGVDAQIHTRVDVAGSSCCFPTLILRFTDLTGWARVGFNGEPLGRNGCDDDFPPQRVRTARSGLWVDFGSIQTGGCDLRLFLIVTHAGSLTANVRAYRGTWTSHGPRVLHVISGAHSQLQGTVAR